MKGVDKFKDQSDTTGTHSDNNDDALARICITGEKGDNQLKQDFSIKCSAWNYFGLDFNNS